MIGWRSQQGVFLLEGAMARMTQAQKIERENERQALQFFLRVLVALPDQRRRQGLRYPLQTVVVTALMAMVCGCDDAEAMQSWGEANREWLEGFLEMPHGPPTQDVFLAVFGALDPEAFSAVFRAWTALLALRLKAMGRHIAVDGKTSRRSFDTASGKNAVHTVSAWMSEAGLVLGQRKTETKSNEITAIPELLKVLELQGATVTIDAMGCQSEIAKTIIEGGGNYLLAVKDNQPTLHQDIQATFAEAVEDRRRSFDEQPRPAVEVFEDVDKGHGRLETRTLSLCRDLSWITTSERWVGLSFVAQILRQRTVLSTGKSSTETAYYIGSDSAASAATASDAIRRHWGVENSLHWILDMAFREDEARHRAKNTAQNMTTLRHFALNIIKADPNRKLGVANSRKRAGWDRGYLLELLTNA
jgi:predicted transposase YbfD/YdcC